MLITLSQISDEVAAITGKPVSVGYGDNFGIRPSPDQLSLEMIVPHGTMMLDDGVRGGIFHEAMHGLYTQWYTSGTLDLILKKQGLKESDKHALLTFMNAFEDIRIELRGGMEFPGAGEAFKAASDLVTPSVIEKIQVAMGTVHQTHGNRSEEFRTMKANLFLLLNILFLNDYEAYPARPGYLPYFPHEELIDMFVKDGTYGQERWWSKELKDELKRRLKRKALGTEDMFNRIRQMFLASPSSAEHYQLCSELFLPKYLSLLGKTAGEINQCQEAMKELTQKMKDGTADQGGGSLEHCHGDGGLTPMEKVFNHGARAVGQPEIKAVRYEDLNYQGNAGMGAVSLDYATATNRFPIIRQEGEKVKQLLRPVIEEIKAWKERGSESLFEKKGRLDMTQLHRIPVGDVTVFKREENPELNEDVAFSLAIDVSGSMYGHEDQLDALNIACAAAWGLNKVMQEIDKPVSIVSFDGRAKIISKGEDLTGQKLAEMIKDGGGGTQINLGAHASIQLLNKTEQETKIMFLITDGHINYGDLNLMSMDLDKTSIIPYFIIIGAQGNDQTTVKTYEQRLKRKVHLSFVDQDTLPEMAKDIARFANRLMRKQL